MRPYKPGPKSRTQRNRQVTKTQHTADLGDETANSLSDSETNESQSGFRSPELLSEVTDYNLDYTSNQARKFTNAAQRNSGVSGQNSSARLRSAEAQNTTTSRSRPSAEPSTSRRKQYKPTSRAFQEYKRIISVNFMVPRLPFGRLVREIMHSFSSEVSKLTPAALEALQCATEAYITQRLEDAYLLTMHRGRKTLSLADLRLIQYLRKFNS